MVKEAAPPNTKIRAGVEFGTGIASVKGVLSWLWLTEKSSTVNQILCISVK